MTAFLYHRSSIAMAPPGLLTQTSFRRPPRARGGRRLLLLYQRGDAAAREKVPRVPILTRRAHHRRYTCFIRWARQICAGAGPFRPRRDQRVMPQVLALERISIEVTNRCAKACWFCYN